jgi:hypothetical protein
MKKLKSKLSLLLILKSSINSIFLLITYRPLSKVLKFSSPLKKEEQLALENQILSETQFESPG